MFQRDRVVVNSLRLIWAAVTIWYELGVFYHTVRHCHWPDAILSLGEKSEDAVPSHVLLIADPQILDHRSYDRGRFLTYLTRIIVDLNLRKSWSVALRRKPDVVVFLGDMMDGGRFDTSDDEYEQYYLRFKRIFKLPTQTQLYYIPGNHDTGLRASTSFSPHARDRYISHFGALNGRISIANHTLVLLDAPSLVEEDNDRSNHDQSYEEWTPVPGGPVEFIKAMSQEYKKGPIVLLSHIPLARDNKLDECGPLREKGTIRPGAGLGYQNTLGKDVTTFVLETVRPSVIFSGDDHDYCEHFHPAVTRDSTTPTREVSVKSISMAMGIRRPGFQLLSLAPQERWLGTSTHPTHADVPCLLPDQIKIYLSVYIPILLVSLLVVFISNAIRVYTSRSNTRSHRRRSSSPSHIALRPQQNGDSSSDEESKSAYLLPRPASALSPKPTLSWSFVLVGKRRRITIGSRSCAIFWGRNSIKPRKQLHGFSSGLARDIRDVAVFPLTLFVVISLWVSV